MTSPRRVFIAGATGAVGKTALSLESKFGMELVPHARAKSAAALTHPRVVTGELDSEAIVTAMKSCTTVMQLIGTMRKRFAQGDTYETSDIGTTRSLVEAAKKAGTIDHLVLLSSVGAGSPTGAYLKAKAEAERLVKDSGIAFTIFRPSAFADREGVFLPGMKTITKLLGLKKYEPIQLKELASGLLYAAQQRAPLGVALEGAPLWDVVHAAMK